ncbi:MAG: SprB repeat-containing protein [Saprospiraceae bacterium]|nr:SprB repeat-containing protein [Saprospiraceae bacterium]
MNAHAAIEIQNIESCICPGHPSQPFEVIATGTAGPFTFSWEGPDNYTSTDQNPTNITTPGQYTVSVTNFYGCTVVLQSSVPACAPVELQGDIQPSCPGQSVGALSIGVTAGGEAPYSYAWSHDAALSGPAAAHLAAGAYQVTVTDARGCQAVGQYDIPDAAPVSLSAAIIHDCGMQHQGSISLSGSGGIGALSYQWHNGWPQPSLQGLGMGQYKVTATDSRGCRATGDYEVLNHALPQLSAQVEPARCLNAQDGAITLSVSTDGNVPYTTLWNTGATGTTLNGLAAGNYSVVVSDQNGCATSATYSTTPAGPQDAMPYIRRVRVFAPQPHPPDIDLYAGEWVSTSAGCIFFTGGSLPISQALFDALAAGQQSLTIEVEASEVMAQVMLGINGENTPFFNSNMFTLPIPSSAVPQLISNNSIYQPLVFMGEDLDGNQLLDLRELSDNLSACVEVPLYQPDCYWQPPVSGGDSDDVHILTRLCMELSIAVLANQSGGFNLKAVVPGDIQQYAFLWSDVSGNIIGNQFTLNGVGPGRYCVKVSGPGGCVAELCENVCESLEDVLDRQLQTTAPCPGQSDGVICLTDSYVPLLVQWLPAGPDGLCLEGVASGIAYCAQVTELACAQQLTFCPDPLSAVAPPVLSLADAGASCPGGVQGFLLVSASGGKPPYVYQWSNGAVGPLAQGLAGATSYTVTVSDACGQQLSQSFSVPAYNPPAFTGATDNAACGESHNGALRVFHQGGQAPYAYQWSGPAGYSASGAEPFINDLAPGNYYVTVTDACGQSTAGGPFEVGWINSANYFQIGAAVIEHICGPDPVGAIDLTVTAADPGSLTYAWSNGATVEDINGLAAGIYSVTVSYENGCSSVKHYNVFQAQIFDLQESLLNPYCKLDDGTISLAPIGQNTGQINYSWSNGAQTEDIAGLPPGTYSVTLTYGLYGICTYSESFTLQEEFTDLTAAVINITPETQIVEDGLLQGEQNGAVTVSVSGGYPPYSFLWSNGAATQNLSGAASGSYWLTVTDSRGCEALVSAFVWLCDFQWPQIGLGAANVTPGPNNTRNIYPEISGGTQPLEFIWSLPDGTAAYSQNLEGVTQEGFYHLTIIDRCGRIDNASIFLNFFCEHAQSLVLENQDPCIVPFNFEQTIVSFSFLVCSPPIDLHHTIATFTWRKDGEEIDGEGGTALLKSIGGSKYAIDSDHPLRDVIIGQNDGGTYCLQVIDEWGCLYSSCVDIHHEMWSELHTGWINLAGTEGENLVIHDYLDEEIPFNAIVEDFSCRTCSAPISDLDECNDDFNRHRLMYQPEDSENPCFGGGTITYMDGTFVDVPFNSTSSLLSNNGQCACLFWPGTISGLLTELPNLVFHEEYVYVEFGCDGSSVVPTSECPDCPLCTWTAVDPDNCIFDVFCITTNTFLHEDLELSSITCIKQTYPSTPSEGECFVITMCEENCYITEELGSCDNYPGGTENLPDCPSCGALWGGTQGEESKRIRYRPLTLQTRPNPFTDELVLEVNCNNEGEYYFELISPIGNIVVLKTERLKAGKQEIVFPAHYFSTDGLYYLRVVNETGIGETLKLVRISR